MIRPSLVQALHEIRAKHIGGEWSPHLWVDAICIDQSSAEDKNKQLKHMGDIYNGAQLVIVWLGTLDPQGQTARGMQFVRDLQELTRLRDYLEKAEHAKNWKALANLTRKSWFTRLWIVQEICAARHAVLPAADRVVKWDDFAAAMSLFVSQSREIRTMLAKTGVLGSGDGDFLGDVHLSGAIVLVENRGSILRKRENGAIAEHGRSLEALITSLSMFQVTEEHDIIYAILWLSGDAGGTSQVRGIHSHERLLPIGVSKHTWASGDPVWSADPEQMAASNAERPRKRSRSRRDETTTYLPVPPRPTHEPSLSEVRNGQRAHELESSHAIRQTEDTGIRIDYSQTVFDMCAQVLSLLLLGRPQHWLSGLSIALMRV